MILREDSESKNNRIITEILGRTNDSRKLSYQESTPFQMSNITSTWLDKSRARAIRKTIVRKEPL